MGSVALGSVVRAPLSGRRVRGWVVEIADRPAERLKEISGVSGAVPVFDKDLAQSLLWAAQHYVAPVAAVLAKASPPNLPRGRGSAPAASVQVSEGGHPLATTATSSAVGKRVPVTAVVGRWQDLDWLESLAPVLSAGRSAMVLAATSAEVVAIHARAKRVYGERALAVSADDDAELTGRWEQAQAPGHLVIGTPRLALWQVADLSLTVVLEEGRRAMKDRQTPTIHVRDLVRTRSRVEGFNTVFFGPTPSVELLAAGAAVVPAARRPWGLVEVVDRSGERPGSGLLSDQVLAALRATVADAGEKAFILTGHRTAPRLVDEINTRVGAGASAVYPGKSIVMVGTERDMAGLEPVSLVVAANADALLMGTGYRAAEEALRQLARLGNMLRAGRGRRMMIQTESPGSDLVQTLRRGNPIPYLERVLVDRARAGLPPSTEMIAIEVRGDSPQGIEDEIAGLGASEVFGPMAMEDGRRWLLAGSLTNVRKDLREYAGRWREKGATIRIDADPIDF